MTAKILAKSYSLRERLLFTAAIVLFLFLGLMGLVLDQAFQRTAEQSEAEKLRIQIYGLLSVTEVTAGTLFLPEALQEPRFNSPGSGLFALVLDTDGKELWRSPSAVALELNSDEVARLHKGLVPGMDKFDLLESQSVFSLSYKILWLGAGEEATEYTFVVLETLDAYRNEISSFRNNLWGWLGIVVIALIAIQSVAMKWGLKPLGELASDLKAIEDGERDYLDRAYPKELAGVTRNLNILLSSERQQREKYRTTLADLAHSLKTPLAILKGSANQLGYDGKDAIPDIQQTIDDQVDRMDQIVGYQLERAVASSSNLIKKAIDVAPIVEKLVTAMNKVYQRKEMDIQLNLQPCTFFGDERDFMELLGNVVDNACKYGETTVRIDIAKPAGADVEIVVEDDGAGIPAADREKVLARGTRLDTKQQGQGIGLAVVVEIVDRYGGKIQLEDSLLGGTRVVINLG